MTKRTLNILFLRHDSPCTLDPNRHLGFTLFELLVVLVIVGLMSAMVLPKLSGHLSTLTLKTTAKKVAAVLRYARNVAATERVVFVTNFYIKENRLRTFAIPLSELHEEGQRLKNEETDSATANEYDLPENISFLDSDSNGKDAESEKISILFFPNGSSNGGEITIVNEKGRMFVLRVDMVTGSVSLTEGNRHAA